MQKIREKLEAKQLKKARLVSFVSKKYFFFTVTDLYFLIMQYFSTLYFRALEAKLYQEKEKQKSKAVKWVSTPFHFVACLNSISWHSPF